MKKMIFGFAALASFAALATTVQSANTFGVLKVTSSDEETIISVPWLKVGATGETDADLITADKIVLTSKLKQGDQLFAYDTSTSTYYTWTLASDGGSWETTATTFSGTGPSSTAPSAVALARGTGLILVRKSEESVSEPIYLYGQYAELNQDTATSTPTRNSEKMVTTVIAPPTTADVNLNSIKITGAQVGDVIKTKLDKSYKLCEKDGTLRWCTLTETQMGNKTVETWTWTETTNATIPAGTGALYVAEKGSTQPKIYWIKQGGTTNSAE